MSRVIVLVGGESNEREISLKTGRSIARALEGLGEELRVLDTGRPDRPALPLADWEALPEDDPLPRKGSDGALLAARFAPPEGDWRPDLVFNALHGGAGEDGTVQALLDWIGVPYTGCGMAASSLAMDKMRSKMIFAGGGLAVPPGYLVNVPVERIPDPAYVDALAKRIESEPGWPSVVKPNREGSSVGLAICEDRQAASLKLPRVIRVSGELLVEAFIPGRELTCAVIGPADAPQALPLVEIIPESGLYDYEHKYEKGKTCYECPADLPEEVTERIRRDSLVAWSLLGCRHLARVDFRLAEDGTPFCLEVNTIPGMTETSLVPMAAAAAGLDFPSLVAEIAELARADAAAGR